MIATGSSRVLIACSALCLPSLLPLHAETENVDVCYNFGCSAVATVQLNQSDLHTLGDLFDDVESAQEERAQIASAIALMEQIVARTLPTAHDLGGNYSPGMHEQGQLDCIDESTNTTAYLNLFQRQGWLRWHSVQARQKRAPYLVDQHWSAVIRELDAESFYVVDSWFYDNGQPPVIQTLADWLANKSIE